jgi:sugar phosphate isomerase/epimerase
MTEKQGSSRREFLLRNAAAAALPAVGLPGAALAVNKTGRRVGAITYSLQYSSATMKYKTRTGNKLDIFGCVEKVRELGGDSLQIFFPMIENMDQGQLKQLRSKAADLDVQLEINGGSALNKNFEKAFEVGSVLGVKMVGSSFGMLMRPDKINTLADWDKHLETCEARTAELGRAAKPFGINYGVENHLDFTMDELHGIMRRVNMANVGVVFDYGNSIGTLDDPLEAAEVLGPYAVATHCKDFAVEENSRGFRFTMVPFGSGSLHFKEITARLLKHLRPEAVFSVEMMTDQNFEVPWILDRFWTAYHTKDARQMAATLRHIRTKAIDPDHCISQDEVDALPHQKHVELEQNNLKFCIAYLRQTLAELSSTT